LPQTGLAAQSVGQDEALSPLSQAPLPQTGWGAQSAAQLEAVSPLSQ
jgi:hypothetical protein